MKVAPFAFWDCQYHLTVSSQANRCWLATGHWCFLSRISSTAMSRFKLVCLIFCSAATLLAESACFAFQSGSRAGASTGSAVGPSPTLAIPQTFPAPPQTAPQNFPSPTFSQPQASQGTQLSHPTWTDAAFSNAQLVPQTGSANVSASTGSATPQT